MPEHTRLVDDIDFDSVVEPDYWQFKVWTSSDGKQIALWEMATPHLYNAHQKCERELVKALEAVAQNPSLQWSLVTQAYIAARKGWIHSLSQELARR